jgi:hypothetical protein
LKIGVIYSACGIRWRNVTADGIIQTEGCLFVGDVVRSLPADLALGEKGVS